MIVRECMSALPDYLATNCSIREAARYMHDMNSGFVPIGENNKLVGIVTDRDLALRALVDGVSPDDKIGSIDRTQVLYCMEKDTLESVLDNMAQQQVQRLIVLNNEQEKEFVGVVSLSDIADMVDNDQDLSQQVVNCCRHYH